MECVAKMLKKGKKACDWCGKVFRQATPKKAATAFVEFSDGTCYHHKCLKKVGGHLDLGKLYKRL